MNCNLKTIAFYSILLKHVIHPHLGQLLHTNIADLYLIAELSNFILRFSLLDQSVVSPLLLALVLCNVKATMSCESFGSVKFDF